MHRDLALEAQQREFDLQSADMQSQLENKMHQVNEMDQMINQTRIEAETVRDDMTSTMENKLQQANSQVSYLQCRLKDVIDDFQQNQSVNMTTVGGGGEHSQTEKGKSIG